MSIVVGVRLRDKVCVSSDQGRSINHSMLKSERYNAPAKLVVRGDMEDPLLAIGVVGVTTWVFICDLALAKDEKIRKKAEGVQTTVGVWELWRDFRRFAVDQNVVQNTPPDDKTLFDSRFIFANKFGLWEINGDGVPASVRTFTSIGDSDAADGAIYALQSAGIVRSEHVDAQLISGTAVSAAIESSPYCDYPVLSVQIKLNDSLCTDHGKILVPNKQIICPTKGKPVKRNRPQDSSN